MLDSFEYGGVWWLPENPENKIHGKLSYNPRIRTVLSLDGAFNEFPDETDFHEIILGVSSDGEKITLKSCLRTNLQLVERDSKEYVTSEFGVSVFYVGCHFAKKEDIKFTRLFVRYSQLKEWLRERLFHHEFGKDEEGLTEHTWKFTKPKAKEIVLDKFIVSITYGFSTSFGGGWETPKFEAHVGISIDASGEMPIDDFFPTAYHLKNFLSLAMGDEVSILAIKGTNKSIKEYGTIQIFYRKRISNQKLFSFPHVPFLYKFISERPEFFLQNWFNLIEKFRPTYDLYFGTVYNPHLYPTHTFLSLAQAIESYHSRKANMNGKYLRTRIEELFEEHRGLFSLFVKNEEIFIGKVVDTRNYYTHYGRDLEKKAAKVLELPFLSDKLRFMLIVILLKEIGFDDKVTKQALRAYMQCTTTRSIYE